MALNHDPDLTLTPFCEAYDNEASKAPAVSRFSQQLAPGLDKGVLFPLSLPIHLHHPPSNKNLLPPGGPIDWTLDGRNNPFYTQPVHWHSASWGAAACDTAALDLLISSSLVPVRKPNSRFGPQNSTSAPLHASSRFKGPEGQGGRDTASVSGLATVSHNFEQIAL